jgi:Protein of unknown function (DUF3176)
MKNRTILHTISAEPLVTEASSNIEHQKRKRCSLSSFFNDWWLWEILSITTSLICMFGIVVTLKVFENKPLPALPSGITFNALISVLATLSKASTLVAVAACISQLKWQWFGETRKMRDFEIFDQASRGPWGSLQLLAKTRSPWLVGLGAAITIVAIGIDPFMQQVIQLTLRPNLFGDGSGAPFGTSASVRRAQTYNAGASLSDCEIKLPSLTIRGFY